MNDTLDTIKLSRDCQHVGWAVGHEVNNFPGWVSAIIRAGYQPGTSGFVEAIRCAEWARAARMARKEMERAHAVSAVSDGKMRDVKS